MIIIGNKQELSKQIGNEIAKLVESKPNAKLILPTGTSPKEVYKQIIEKYNEGLSFYQVETFNLDEYMGIDVDLNPKSFKNFMKLNLFDHIDINSNNTYFPSTPETYDDKLDAVNEIDFAMIGVGTNGHIAFNEPPVEYNKRTNVVTLTKTTIQSNFPSMEEYPTKAITMGLLDIVEKPKKLVLLAWGESKREALEKYKEAIKTQQTNPDWPITYLIKTKNLVIYTDIEI